MKKLFFLLISSIALSFITGCDESPTDYTSRREIDTKINVTVTEELTAPNKNFYLELITVKIYPCFNFGIEYIMQRRVDDFNIKLLNIIEPGVCLTALGPAYSRINLGNLSTGSYNLNFEVNGTKENAVLIITDSTYFISHPPQIILFRWLNFNAKIINRVPDYTIWGYIGYIHDSLSTEADQFLDSLEQIGAASKYLNPGDYHHFKILTDNTLEPPQYSGYPYTKLFTYEYRGDIKKIWALVNWRRDGLYDKLYITCSSWKGDYIF